MEMNHGKRSARLGRPLRRPGQPPASILISLKGRSSRTRTGENERDEKTPCRRGQGAMAGSCRVRLPSLASAQRVAKLGRRLVLFVGHRLRKPFLQGRIDAMELTERLNHLVQMPNHTVLLYLFT